MIQVTDPTTLTPIPKRTYAELEEFAVFVICVAGKTARIVQRQLRGFWDHWCLDWFQIDCERTLQPTPFLLLRRIRLDEIQESLREFGMGCYTAKGRGLYELSRSRIDLRTCKPADLEKIHSVGPKTSRFFVMYTQPGARVAALDTHILRWLREQGVDAPHQSPSGRRYRELEEQFISMVPPEKTIAEFDLEIWNRYSRKVNV